MFSVPLEMWEYPTRQPKYQKLPHGKVQNYKYGYTTIYCVPVIFLIYIGFFVYTRKA